MRIYTDRGVLVRLTNIRFNAVTFKLLHELSMIAENLRLEAVEVHTGKPFPVRLCALSFDWPQVNSINI